mgnify:CR=1 FL=1
MITKIGADALQQKDNADERPGLGHLATGLGGLGLLDAVLTREGSMRLTRASPVSGTSWPRSMILYMLVAPAGFG